MKTFKNFNSFKGRIDRKQFIIATIIITVIDFILEYINVHAYKNDMNIFIAIWIAILLLNIVHISFMVRRIHDLSNAHRLLVILSVAITIFVILILTVTLSFYFLSKDDYIIPLALGVIIFLTAYFFKAILVLYLAIKKGTPDKNKYDIDVLLNKTYYTTKDVNSSK